MRFWAKVAAVYFLLAVAAFGADAPALKDADKFIIRDLQFQQQAGRVRALMLQQELTALLARDAELTREISAAAEKALGKDAEKWRVNFDTLAVEQKPKEAAK